MSTNVHYEWTSGSTLYKPTSMNPAISDIDKAITYIKNIIVCHDGDITYSKISGQLVWDDTIRIIFNTEAGDVVLNTISSGSKYVNDHEMAYVTLNETSGTILTVSVAEISLMSASGFIDYNILVLGYKNASCDRFFSNWLDINPDYVVQGV